MKGRYILAISLVIALALSMYIYVFNSSIVIKDEHDKKLDFEGNFKLLRIIKSSNLEITVYGNINTVKVESCRDITIKAYKINEKEVKKSENIKFEIIHPTPPPPLPPGKHSIYLDTNRGGTLSGELEFRVTGDYSYIRIGHHTYNLKKGDIVKIEVPNVDRARIYITSMSVNAFYSKAKLYINNQYKTEGHITRIWISNYADLRSTLKLEVEKKWSWTDFRWDGREVIHGNDNSEITINDLMPNGVLNLNLKRSSIYLSGAASSYTIPPPPPPTTTTTTVPTTTTTVTPTTTPTVPTTVPTPTVITTIPTPTVTVPTPVVYNPYNSPAIDLYYPPGNPGGYLLTITFTINGPVKITNAYGDIISKEIYSDGHGARLQIVGYVQTHKYISVQLNDFRSGKHVIKIEISAPAGVEIGVKSKYDRVDYISRNVWVVTSRDSTFSMTFDIYTLPIASGVRNVLITVTAV